jgi:hypothetical protein
MEGEHRFLSPKGENLSPKRENEVGVERFATRGERFVVALGRDPTREGVKEMLCLIPGDQCWKDSNVASAHWGKQRPALRGRNRAEE